MSDKPKKSLLFLSIHVQVSRQGGWVGRGGGEVLALAPHSRYAAIAARRYLMRRRHTAIDNDGLFNLRAVALCHYHTM